MVSVFLRELEYYQGIMFLTTNRVKDIDDAIASRLHLPLKYKSLALEGRRGTWESFLKKAVTRGGPLYYSRKDLGGKRPQQSAGRDFDRLPGGFSCSSIFYQIKNIVSTAHALITRKGNRVTITDLEVAIDAGEDFDCNFRGASQAANIYSYV